MFRHSRFLLVIFLLISCRSESFTDSEKDRARLMNGFESYASRDEVMTKLNRRDAIKSVEQSSKHKGAQPPYEIYSARLPYEDLKEPGELLITFFNNRLMQMSFYPEDLDRYLAALRSNGVELHTGSELKNGHTAIWIGQDFDNKNYVGWADDRLRAQQRRWLSRYS